MQPSSYGSTREVTKHNTSFLSAYKNLLRVKSSKANLSLDLSTFLRKRPLSIFSTSTFHLYILAVHFWPCKRGDLLNFPQFHWASFDDYQWANGRWLTDQWERALYFCYVMLCILLHLVVTMINEQLRILSDRPQSQAFSFLVSWWWRHSPLQNLRGCHGYYRCLKIRSIHVLGVPSVSKAIKSNL